MLPLEQGREFVAFACFASPLEAVIRDAESVLSPKGGVVALSELTLPDQPYRSEVMSAVLWAPRQRPSSTAFMAGFSDGWATLVHILATKYGHMAAKVRLSRAQVEWPIVELVVYGPGAERRGVRAMRDSSRWEFFEWGETLDFEETSAYSSRRVRDRFTAEMLGRYLSALGWDATDREFWATDQAAFEACGRLRRSPRGG